MSFPIRGPLRSAGLQRASALRELQEIGERFVPSRFSLVLIIVAIIATVSFRASKACEKTFLTHDESISYLATTGHLASYQDHFYNDQVGSLASWGPASRLTAFLQPEEFWNFTGIRKDLNGLDIHPPLYFWLLHVWSHVVGVHLWTGPMLNAILFVLTLLTVFQFARYVLRDDIQAAVVVLTLALSPSLVLASNAARQQDLMLLSATLFAWQGLRCLDISRACGARDLVLLALCAAVGTLTHYHFFLLLAGFGILAAYRIGRTVPARFFAVCAAIVAGCILFAILNPGFLNSLAQQQAQAQTFSASDIVPRLIKVAKVFVLFFVHADLLNLSLGRYSGVFPASGIARLLTMLALTGALATLSVLVVKHRRMLFRRASLPIAELADVLFLFAWVAGLTTLLYVAGISPRHAMGGRYLSLALPFFAFLPAWLLHASGEEPRRFATVYAVLFLIASVGGLACDRILTFNSPSLIAPMARADRVVIASTGRGFAPRLALGIPATTPLYLGSAERLLEVPEAWASAIRPGEQCLLITTTGSRDAEREAKALVAFLSQRYRVAPCDLDSAVETPLERHDLYSIQAFTLELSTGSR